MSRTIHDLRVTQTPMIEGQDSANLSEVLYLQREGRLRSTDAVHKDDYGRLDRPDQGVRQARR
jgi:hypothetical protein